MKGRRRAGVVSLKFTESILLILMEIFKRDRRKFFSPKVNRHVHGDRDKCEGGISPTMPRNSFQNIIHVTAMGVVELCTGLSFGLTVPISLDVFKQCKVF